LHENSVSLQEDAFPLKEGAYRIGSRVVEGSTWYLTRRDEDVWPDVLREKSNSQIWHVKPDPEVVGIYRITSFEDSDLSLTYDGEMKLVVDGVIKRWTLGVRGSQFVIGDFANEKAIDLDRNLQLKMKPRADSMERSDHSQWWTFTTERSTHDPQDQDDGGDVPCSLRDWRDTELKSGVYFVQNGVGQWVIWDESTGITAPLTTYNFPDRAGSNRFYSGAFSFVRNSDGSYYISNFCKVGSNFTERFVQVSGDAPILAEAESKCRLYGYKDNNGYAIGISGSGKSDLIIYDPPTANVNSKHMNIQPLGELESLALARWSISKQPF